MKSLISAAAGSTCSHTDFMWLIMLPDRVFKLIRVRSYPAHGQLQLQLCQPSTNAHPFSNAEGNVGEGVNGAVLSQPALRLKLLPVIKVLLIGAQNVAVYH